MYPKLFTIGPYTLHTYGFLMFLGVVVAILVIRTLASRPGIDHVRITKLLIVLAFIGYFGTKFLFMLTSLWANGFSVSVAWEALTSGGLVWYGSVIFGIPYLWWGMRKYRIPLWRALDAIIPGIAIGHAIGRIGCFMGGCCYGIPTDAWFGICFPAKNVGITYAGIPLHPTQLYEAGGEILTFAFLLYLFRVKRFDGQVFLAYLLIYPILRSIIEVFRGDLIRGFIIEGVLSTSQAISIAVVLFALTLLYLRLSRIKRAKL
jgi:phosphatidylglycerol:prolipoprotein diacylglycerol transferase